MKIEIDETDAVLVARYLMNETDVVDDERLTRIGKGILKQVRPE